MSNLLKRIIVGITLGALIIISLIIDNPILLFIINLIWIALATNEFLRILSLKQIFFNRFFIIGLNLAFPTIFYFSGPPALYLILPACVLLYALFKREQYYLIVPYGVFILFYLGFLPSHLLFLKFWIKEQNLSSFVVLFPVLFTWINDTAAYGVGSAIGRHKLAVKISPNKTIEGFVGSIIISVVFSIFYLNAFFPNISLILLIIIGIILSVGAQIGDLVESGFKREVGVKDSSQALPGHGGFLDRIDSLLFTIPIFYYFLIYFIV